LSQAPLQALLVYTGSVLALEDVLKAQTRIKRRKCSKIKVGAVAIGGNSPVSVQSMTKTFPEDVAGTLRQVKQLAKAGAQIVRLAVPGLADALTFGQVRAKSPVPLVADTHFDPRVALAALDAGADKVRVNPGNTRSQAMKDFAAESGCRGIPVRIGVNSGSVYHRKSSRGDIARDMVHAAISAAKRFEDWGQSRLILSMKAPTAWDTVRAYRLAAEKCSYPLHIGVTAAGPQELAAAKSNAALGALLLEGIGDTLRFSYTGDPVAEVSAGLSLLQAVGLRQDGVDIASCPTCGRCRVGLEEIVEKVRRSMRSIDCPLTVAVMGCVVNGPGEARSADIGLAGAPDGSMVLFASGERIKRLKSVPAAIRELSKEALKLAAQKRRKNRK
jgi:(E)-4-hydroxy-3-methylbut-2-enyl-diphosphate synthase